MRSREPDGRELLRALRRRARGSQLNQDVKRHMREIYPKPTDKTTLRAELARFLHRRQRQPKIIAAYLHEASVRYAAADTGLITCSP